jgi:hypothetical protein
MKRACFSLVFAASIVAWPAGVRAQEAPPRSLALVFERDGSVSLSAQNVTVREIFAEWALRCGCFVVNAAKLTGAPIPIPVMFDHAPQAAVLESLLRQAAGYVLTPKRAGSASPSNYDVIYILATSTATAPPAAAYSAPVYQPVMATPIVTAGSPDDEIPPAQPPRAENTPATPPPQPPTSTSRTSSPGVSIVPIIPIGGSVTTSTAPGTSTPAPRP